MKIFKPLTTLLLVVSFSLMSRSALTKDYDMGDQTVKGSKAEDRPIQANRVHRAGLFWINVTNNGYFGNPDNLQDPCTGKTAVSGELPGGSGTDFLFAGSLLFGGYLANGEQDSINNQPATIFEGPYVTTSYEGWTGAGGPSDMARECWPIKFSPNPDGTIPSGQIREISNVEGRVSCLFEDVYDPTATAEEQFNVMYTDKYVNQTPYTGMDDFDERQHMPLGIEVRQNSYAWSYDYAQKFVIMDYTLYNRNEDQKDMYNFFMGVYLDCDIGMTTGDWSENHADDLGGFIQKWDNYIDPATGNLSSVDLNLAWAADNDGRNYTGASDAGAPGSGDPLDGATAIATVRVLRNPNPNLRYAFNMYVASQFGESEDWGPRWETGLHPRPQEDHPGDPDPALGAVSWKYDLTVGQKGYDDVNQDMLNQDNSPSGLPLYAGRTEGRPTGDIGRYMVLSNDEFDYEQYKLRDLYLNLLTDPPGTEAQYAQADKWQQWNGDPLQPDGSVEDLNALANGADVKYLLSFGPLGTESTTDVGYDSVYDRYSTDEPVPNAIIEDKTIWKFAYGDSLKLTLAFIVNDNFHTSLDQDPNYADDSVVNLDDGIDPSLYDKGWYDALYNVIWAERVYDIPMFDTFVTNLGETKGDGWYGEDVGVDAIFGDIRNDTFCWWLEVEYSGPDEGEGDFALTSFAAEMTDVYGHVSASEDHILPFGRETEDVLGIYGITGDPANGDRDGYGYMVRYDNLLNPHSEATPGQWIRYGFDNGKIDVGDGVPDFTGPPPPPSPNTEVTFNDNDIIVEWQSCEFFKKEADDAGNVYDAYSGPEFFIDPFTRIKDFEGYQVQVSPNSNSLNYVELFSVDNVNHIYENIAEHGDFLDSPYSQAEYDSLVAGGFQQIASEGKIWQLVEFGDNRSILEDWSSSEIYTYTVVPDTAIINIALNTLDTIPYYKYKFVLHNKMYAKESYIAVTSSDFGDPKTGTPALKSNPAINGTSVIPTSVSANNDIYVVPNPYRGDVDYEKMGWENVGDVADWEEQDRKIVFMNIPLHSVIRIYTLAGDLVKTIGHNGISRVNARYQHGEYGAAWDLINDNNQAVVSGIYLYSVQDVEDSGYEKIGKFVIIK